MSKTDLDRWYQLHTQEELTREEVRELVQLNHLVMEAAHYIHNESMTGRYQQ